MQTAQVAGTKAHPVLANPVGLSKLGTRAPCPHFKEIWYRHFDRQSPANRGPRINEQIRVSPIRLIGVAREQRGLVPTAQALEAAREAGLDLVDERRELVVNMRTQLKNNLTRACSLGFLSFQTHVPVQWRPLPFQPLVFNAPHHALCDSKLLGNPSPCQDGVNARVLRCHNSLEQLHSTLHW
jgi:hypothetical protein